MANHDGAIGLGATAGGGTEITSGVVGTANGSGDLAQGRDASRTASASLIISALANLFYRNSL
ncbi:hypothetical protein ACFLT8_01005 [Chloroflexota bacterium]